MIRRLLLPFFFFLSLVSEGQKHRVPPVNVIAYYAGSPTMIDSFPVGKLTHLIFSFCHLKGDSLAVMNARDSATIQNMVALKRRNPQLQVMLSLGGWGGCKTCSTVFGSPQGRKTFARTARALTDYFGTDGIDLDWEYPVIPGFPGHTYSEADKKDFTALVKILRRRLGKDKEISFAAGGFKTYIDSSVDWKRVMPFVDRVNLMSYDISAEGSDRSGHHTPLYSPFPGYESVDAAVRQLLTAGVDPSKIAIGAAFYAKFFLVSDTLNHGLNQPSSYYRGLPFKHFQDSLSTASGFTRYWDTVARAPYSLNAAEKLFATYDDSSSIRLKTEYAIRHHLNGIMFWQLADDDFEGGLLDVIDAAIKEESGSGD